MVLNDRRRRQEEDTSDVEDGRGETGEDDEMMLDDGVDDDNSDDAEIVINTTAPSLYLRPAFFNQTRRKGKIRKTVTERYLRDDLGLGCHYVDEGLTNRRAKEATEAKPKTIENTTHLLSLLKTARRKSATSSSSSSSQQVLVVCDTNVLLHNLDVIEQSQDVMPNVVFPQTALVECRKNRMVAYDRVVDMLHKQVGAATGATSSSDVQVGNESGDSNNTSSRCCIYFPDMHHSQTAHVGLDYEDNDAGSDEKGDSEDNVNGHLAKKLIKSVSINDENDARIRNVAHYLGENLKGTNFRVVLLTDDVESRKLAMKESSGVYEAWSVRSWIKELDGIYPGLALTDLVAQYGGGNETRTSNGGQDRDGLNSQQDEVLFVSHVDQAAMSIGIKSGRYYRGVLRSKDSMSAYVTIRRGEERVAVTINGSKDRNRAIDGDVVAIELNPLDKWISPLSDIPSSSPSKNSRSNTIEGAGIASETAEPTVNELANVPDAINIDDVASLKPTGRVVGILRRNFASYSGSIFERPSHSSTSGSVEKSECEIIALENEREYSDGSMMCVFFPVDTKIPPILIRTTQRDRLLGQRIVVTMDSWPLHSRYPLGHYVETIGEAGSKDVETEVLLQQFKIAHEPFSAAVLACLPPNDYKIEMVPDRVDLRHLPVLSIDPPGCKDIDDALHCIVLPNGNYQVGVSIADVTHYVSPGSAIDIEAANRSTSTYLVNKRLDMLPALLTTDLCSLKSNVDRYAFTVLWEVTPDAEILNVDFKKTVIHSIAALTYQQAQSFIDQPDSPKEEAQVGAVKRLASLARKFRKKRIDAGALTLASPEVKFVLDSESLNPTDVQSYALLEANALVEEFMLLANITVAKKILRHYPTLSVLRRHPSPNRTMFEGLISKARCRGFEIDIDNSKKLADSLDAAVIENEPYFNKLLRILSTRCMSPAQYFCSGECKAMDYHHFGLAAPVYTHFTSPIRRYADVCVHRLLAAAINVAPLPPHLSSKSYLHDLCANMNRRHRAAQLAGRASVQLHTLIFFANDSSKDEDAYVLDVETADKSDPILSVIVPRYGIEGRIKLPIDSEDPNLVRVPKEHKIIVRKASGGGKDSTIQVFDKVRVKIFVRQLQEYQRELVMELVTPSIASDPSKKREVERSEEQPHKQPTKRGRRK